MRYLVAAVITVACFSSAFAQDVGGNIRDTSGCSAPSSAVALQVPHKARRAR